MVQVLPAEPEIHELELILERCKPGLATLSSSHWAGTKTLQMEMETTPPGFHYPPRSPNLGQLQTGFAAVLPHDSA